MTAQSPPLTPLEMAVNSAAAVLRYADYQERNPLEAHVNQAGTNGVTAAKIAAAMALVSIAQDLHRIVTLIDEMDGE